MEIIKRKSVTEREAIRTDGFDANMQVSYNNYGHIALRFLNAQKKFTCKHCGLDIEQIADNIDNAGNNWYHSRIGVIQPNMYCIKMTDKETPESLVGLPHAEPGEETGDRDTLIVLSTQESKKLIEFIKREIA